MPLPLRLSLPLLFALASLCACAPGGAGDDDVEASPTPIPDYYRMSETGRNLELSGHIAWDANGNVTEFSGHLNVLYEFNVQHGKVDGSQASNCITRIREQGPLIEPGTGDVQWVWHVTRTMVADACRIGMIPAELNYGFDSSDPGVFSSNRFTQSETMQGRYTIAPDPVIERGDAEDGTSWEDLSLQGAIFEYKEGDWD